MFKAPLINNPKYYTYRRWELMLSLLPIGSAVLLSIFFKIPWLIFAGLVALQFIFFVVHFKIQQNLKKTLGKQVISIDESSINIWNTSNELLKSIQLDKKYTIITKKQFAMHADSLQDIKQELKGDSTENYLVLKSEQQEQSFHFEFNSYYSVQQLEKIMATWLAKGYNIQRV